MPIHNRIAAHPIDRAWRPDPHRHPRLALEEQRTSDWMRGNNGDIPRLGSDVRAMLPERLLPRAAR